MPGRGRSSFTKRQKEHTRQQKQRDKAERRSQRKTEEPLGAPSDSSELDLDELQGTPPNRPLSFKSELTMAISAAFRANPAEAIPNRNVGDSGNALTG